MSQGRLPPEALGRVLPASASFWGPRASPGLWLCHPHLCLIFLWPLCWDSSGPAEDGWVPPVPRAALPQDP